MTPPRVCTCVECGQEFEAPHRVGRPPTRCSTECYLAYKAADQRARMTRLREARDELFALKTALNLAAA